MAILKDIPSLPFGTIRDQLNSLLVTVANKLEREWPTQWASYPEAAVVLRATLAVAENTFNTIRSLCADEPAHPSWKSEYAVSVPPLTRTILDNLFTIVFLFEDLPARSKWFLKSGWRELYEENQRYLRTYGSDPAWKESLAKQSWFLDYAKTGWQITPEEVSNPKEIKWWPNPGKMIMHTETSKPRRDYLAYLNDWFYKELSSESHLSWPGLAKRSMHLLNKDRDDHDTVLDKFRSDCFTMSIALLLAFLSEIQIELGYDLSERLKYIWHVLNPGFNMVRELYDYRYANLL